MVWIYYLVIIILVLLILLSKMTIEFTFNRDNQNDFVKVRLSYLKFIKFSEEISLIDIDKKGKEYGLKLHSKILGNKKSNRDTKGFMDFKTVINNIDFFIKHYNESKNRLFKIIEYLRKNIIIDKLDFKMEVGVENAAYTGILIGCMYSIIYNICFFISNNVRVNSNVISILPNFNATTFKANFNCIFKLHIGNIIYIGIGNVIYIVSVFILSLIRNDNNSNVLRNIIK